MIDNQLTHGEQALAPERKKPRPVKNDVNILIVNNCLASLTI